MSDARRQSKRRRRPRRRKAAKQQRRAEIAQELQARGWSSWDVRWRLRATNPRRALRRLRRAA